MVTRLAEAARPDFDPFWLRCEATLPRLVKALAALYGEREDFGASVLDLVESLARAWCERRPALRALDEEGAGWIVAPETVGAMGYVDLFGGSFNGVAERIPYLLELGVNYLHLLPVFRCPEGENDGGYAISDYREVNPALGSVNELRALIERLREAGIRVALDFVFNHTANEHEWARKAYAGDPDYAAFYHFYTDRSLPDVFDRHLREIFPDEHPGRFSELPDGRWVWTTFHSYQWDLNYENPKVFRAMCEEMLHIANLGVSVLRLDAAVFAWKRLGTRCESLPEVHELIRAFNAAAYIVVPSLVLKSEAIVPPDEVRGFVSPDECPLSYNPGLMAMTWDALAWGDTRMMRLGMSKRQRLPEGCAWLNYLTCHDDVLWLFDDGDCIAVGDDPLRRRQRLTRYYTADAGHGEARGLAFQYDEATSVARACGTLASLCGLGIGDPLAEARMLAAYALIMSVGGIPLIYLGDEVAALNDYGFLDDPVKAGDGRWVQRVRVPERQYGRRHDAATAAGRIHSGLRRLVEARRGLPALAGTALTVLPLSANAVLGFTRGGADNLLVLINFSAERQVVPRTELPSGAGPLADVLGGVNVTGTEVELAPYQCRWLTGVPFQQAHIVTGHAMASQISAERG